MAITTSLFNLYYTQFKRAYPNGTDEQFIRWVEQRHPDKARGIKIQMRDAQKAATTEALRMKTTQEAANQAIRDKNLVEAQKLAAQQAPKGGAIKTIKDFSANVAKSPVGKVVGFVDKGIGGLENIINVGGAMGNVVTNWNAPGSNWMSRTQDILGVGGAIGGALLPGPKTVGGTLGGIASRNAAGEGEVQRQSNQDFSYHLGSYDRPSMDYNTEMTPEQREKFLNMMQDKQLGGSGERFRPKYSQSYAPQSTKEEAVQVDNNNGNGGELPPTTGLIMDNNNGDNSNNIVPQVVDLESLEIDPSQVQGDVPILGESNSTISQQVPVPGQQQVAFTDNGVAEAIVSQAQSDELMSKLLNSEGSVTPQQMREMIDKYYQGAQAIANQNPYYGGEYVLPQGYEIDPRIARFQAQRDALDAATGVQSRNLLKGYLDTQQAEYNAKMAQQAGVPYQDYVDGMTERNKQLLELEKQRVTDQLTAYAQQSTDMNTRLNIARQIVQTQQAYDNKIAEIEAQGIQNRELEKIKGKYDIGKELVKGDIGYKTETLKQQGDLYKEYYKANNPQAVMLNAAKMMSFLALAFGGDVAAMARYAAAMPAGTQQQIFGKALTPEQYTKMFGAVTNMDQSQPGWRANFQNFLNQYNNINSNFGM